METLEPSKHAREFPRAIFLSFPEPLKYTAVPTGFLLSHFRTFGKCRTPGNGALCGKYLSTSHSIFRCSLPCMSVVSSCLYPDAAGRRILAFVNVLSSFGCMSKMLQVGPLLRTSIKVSLLLLAFLEKGAVCVAFAVRPFSYGYSEGSRFILYLFAKHIICSERLAMKKSEMDVLVIWGQ